MTRQALSGYRTVGGALAFLVVTALLALAVGTGSARAAGGGTYRITAGGNQDWGPASGGIDQTSSDPISKTDTLVGSSGAVGQAHYELQAGPGVVRTKIDGSVSIPGGLFYPFNPSTQAVSSTELTVSGPPGFVNVSINLHVDGILDIPVCTGDNPNCGGLSVAVSAGVFTVGSEFNTVDGGTVRQNDLGLAFDPIPGGFHIHGDVTLPPFGVPTNTPVGIPIVVNLSGRFGASATFDSTFDDPAIQYQVSFPASGPVLDVPPGYTVSGPNVTDNHWTDPFAETVPPDSTSPTVVGVPDRQPNVFGWYRAPVTIDWQASDDSSQASDPPDTVADQDGKDVPYTSNPSCDPSNNCATGTVSLSLDQVPPVVTCREAPVFEVTQNSIAFVSADESDALSGSGGETPGVGVDISSAGQKTVDITGEDFAGNTTTVTCPYTVVDSTSPTVVGVPDRQPNVFGWYRAPVTIDWQASDDSSQASDPPDTVADQDGKDVPYTSNPSCDPSNNCATGTVSLSLDQVPPVVTCREAPVFEVTQNSIAFVSADESDALSGSGGETPGVGVDISSAGQKTVDITGEDFAGNTTTVTCPYTVVDTRSDTQPPVVTVPADMAVDATSPAGGKAGYSASATDDVDSSPTLACTPPSGSVFPIGTTTVTCRATDAAGNSGSASFKILVRSAGEQVANLTDKTLAYLDLPALRPALKAALQAVADAIAARHPKAACVALDLYVVAVKLAPAKAFTAAEKADLIADATRIKAVIGC